MESFDAQRRMLRRWRLVIGFLVAPLATPVTVYCVSIGIQLMALDGRGSLRRATTNAGIVSAFGTVVAYAVMFTAGVLAVRLSYARRWVRSWQYALLGAVVGMLPFFGAGVYYVLASLFRTDLSISEIASRWMSTAPRAIRATLLGCACGSIDALLFWAIAIRTRVRVGGSIG